MTIDKEVSSHASIFMTENQDENSPSSMPTTEPPPQTIDQGNKDQCDNVQNNKKRKVREASTKTKDVSNAVEPEQEPGKKKPCRPKSWVWDHFTKVDGSQPCRGSCFVCVFLFFGVLLQFLPCCVGCCSGSVLRAFSWELCFWLAFCCLFHLFLACFLLVLYFVMLFKNYY
ncbi:unnamed protein product [Trifolium pratense]|uniref:Uncharacterized protein n=1 Tax=Trifolium pratense TaxID=57577 RepID=A0ACB0LLM1_TRIPR|nr:unnamed protein product [Trifolium pratense]